MFQRILIHHHDTFVALIFRRSQLHARVSDFLKRASDPCGAFFRLNHDLNLYQRAHSTPRTTCS